MNTNNTVIAAAVAFLLIGGAYYLSDPNSPTYVIADEALAAQFEHLRVRTTNSCGGGKAVVLGLPARQSLGAGGPEDGRLQGSCCQRMDPHSYEEQVAGLKAKYGEYEIIPPDPYDVPVLWAREMIEYDERTALTSEQQAVYDKATELSHEGGPCCCVCWHWFAYEGLAKHLIINESFTSAQIADVWDLSDACGGDHHHHHEEEHH